MERCADCCTTACGWKPGRKSAPSIRGEILAIAPTSPTRRWPSAAACWRRYFRARRLGAHSEVLEPTERDLPTSPPPPREAPRGLARGSPRRTSGFALRLGGGGVGSLGGGGGGAPPLPARSPP